MVKNARNQIARVVIALTLGASSMAQSVEEAHYQILATGDSIGLCDYPAQVQSVVTLPGSQHSAEGFRRPAAYFFTAKAGVAVTSDVLLNQHNLRWTPSLRLRNEIMLEVSAPSQPDRAMTWTW